MVMIMMVVVKFVVAMIAMIGERRQDACKRNGGMQWIGDSASEAGGDQHHVYNNQQPKTYPRPRIPAARLYIYIYIYIYMYICIYIYIFLVSLYVRSCAFFHLGRS